MKRDFRKILTAWKDHPLRKPLIVRGARQVGKTFIIEAFGREEFTNLITLNLEAEKQYHQCFETLDPRQIIIQIELISNRKILSGETLLFFDEIQQCPKAIQALRYFKEQLPDLHVIAAGSLLEFAIREEDFSFPVGRVQFAKLYPLSFEEYLDANGDSALRTALSTFDLPNPPPPAVHEHYLKKVAEYFVIGGMPASIVAYLATHSYLEVKYAQKALWDAFEVDFGKYSQKTQFRHLKKIFEEGPKMIGTHVKYNRFDPDLPNPAREMKHAIELLRLAGLLHPIHAVSGSIPLLEGLKPSIFKLLFLDIGLVEQVMNIDPQNPGLMMGPLAEQFVGQELLATSDPVFDSRLFFWMREKTGSSAEVDYLYTHKGDLFPIEVKAGKAGKLKSMHLFIQEKKAPLGIKISQEALNWNKEILTVPFYMMAHLPRLLDSCMQ